jgi:L-glutamine-phosphate cytidylyltransferase
MKAIILAAGEGRRLRPLTNDRPKCMVEYRGRPLIDWNVAALRANGVNDIVVVRGYRAEAIQIPGARYYQNSRYAETNMVYTFFCAEEELNEDILICYSDIIYSAATLAPLLKSTEKVAVLLDSGWRALWEARMEDPLKDAETLKLDGAGFITELGKKPQCYEDIQGQYMGLIKISKEALPAIRELYHGLDRSAQYDGKSFENMYMTSFIQLIIDRVMPVKGVLTAAQWLEVDAVADLECQVNLGNL